MVFKIFDEVCQGLLFSETNSKSFAMACKVLETKKRRSFANSFFSNTGALDLPFRVLYSKPFSVLEKNAPENTRLAAFGM